MNPWRTCRIRSRCTTCNKTWGVEWEICSRNCCLSVSWRRYHPTANLLHYEQSDNEAWVEPNLRCATKARLTHRHGSHSIFVSVLKLEKHKCGITVSSSWRTQDHLTQVRLTMSRRAKSWVKRILQTCNKIQGCLFRLNVHIEALTLLTINERQLSRHIRTQVGVCWINESAKRPPSQTQFVDVQQN
jgi:hypothetical protein